MAKLEIKNFKLENMKCKVIYFLPIIIILHSCFSTSMMQTAKTLDEGESQIAVGLSGYYFEDEFGLAPEVNYRQGINSKSDFGLGYSVGLNGHIKADYKRLLFNSTENNLYFSSGIGFDLFMPDGDFLFASTIPLYLSLHKNPKFVPYFAQRFTLSFTDLSAFKYKDITNPGKDVYYDHYMFYSGAAGLQFGENRIKWFMEASYSVTFNNTYGSYSDVDLETGLPYYRIEDTFYAWGNFQVSFGIIIMMNGNLSWSEIKKYFFLW